MKILITGATRGIGRDTALLLAAAGHQVLVLGRTETALTELQAKAAAAGSGAIIPLTFDLNTSEPQMLENAIRQMSGLDVLINNAGLLINKPFDDLSPADWQACFQTNFFSVVALIRLVLPFLQTAGGAHIVNIGSMGGVQGSAKFNGLAAYSASKAALANLTECLAEEFREQKIAVNCLSLGAVQTEMLSAAFPGYQAPVTSRSMGEFLAWFAIEGHRFFNGKILPVSVSTP